MVDGYADNADATRISRIFLVTFVVNLFDMLTIWSCLLLLLS